MFLSKKWNPDLKIEFKDFYKKHLKNHIVDIEENEEINKDVYKLLAKQGYFDYLDTNFNKNATSYAVILKELSKVSGALALSYHVNFLCGLTILKKMKDEESKEKYLTQLKQGDIICALALTEPNAGSDITSIETLANGNKDNYVVNGSKKFIVNGIKADIFILAAKTSINNKESSIFLLDRDGNNEQIVPKKLKTLGTRGSGLSLITFKDAKIKKENLLGESVLEILDVINFDRIGALIISLGMAESALEKTLNYVRNRQQFGKKIGEFQGVQFMISEMTSSVKVIDNMVDITLKEYANDKVDNVSLAINKVVCTTLMEKTVSMALDLFGGNGYLEEYGVERIFRDSKSVVIGGGTREVLKNVIGKHMVNKYQI